MLFVRRKGLLQVLSPALCELVEGLLELHPEERFCLGEQLALVWTMCLSSWSLVVGTCCGATSGQHQEFGRLDEHHRFLPPAPAGARLESLKRRISALAWNQTRCRSVYRASKSSSSMNLTLIITCDIPAVTEILGSREVFAFDKSIHAKTTAGNPDRATPWVYIMSGLGFRVFSGCDSVDYSSTNAKCSRPVHSRRATSAN